MSIFKNQETESRKKEAKLFEKELLRAAHKAKKTEEQDPIGRYHDSSKSSWGKVAAFFKNRFIIGILSAVIPFILTHYISSSAKFKSLGQYVKMTADGYDEVYFVCKQPLPDKQFLLAKMNKFSNSLNLLTAQHLAMYDDHFINAKTYCAIHAFTSYNTILQKEEQDACHFNFMSNHANDQWANHIVNVIYNDAQVKSLTVPFINLFRDIISLMDIRGKNEINKGRKLPDCSQFNLKLPPKLTLETTSYSS